MKALRWFVHFWNMQIGDKNVKKSGSLPLTLFLLFSLPTFKPTHDSYLFNNVVLRHLLACTHWCIYHVLSTNIKSQLQYLQFGMLGLKQPAGALLPVPVSCSVCLTNIVLLKTNISPRSKAWMENMLVLTTSNISKGQLAEK